MCKNLAPFTFIPELRLFNMSFEDKSIITEPQSKKMRFENFREDENAARLDLIKFQKTCLRVEHEARMEVINLEKDAAIAKANYYVSKGQVYGVQLPY